MEAFVRVKGVAAALLRDHIDTDVIIPSREITSPARDGYGVKLFAPWRYLDAQRTENPDFVLNKAPFRAAKVLIAGANFGCGSSREMAAWALRQFGLRAIVAPSFGAIFRANAMRNGLLPVVLPGDVVRALAAEAAGGTLELDVDLPAGRIGTPDGRGWPIEIDAREREMLLRGLDAIDLTWQQRDAIEAFERLDRQRRPWIWR